MNRQIRKWANFLAKYYVNFKHTKNKTPIDQLNAEFLFLFVCLPVTETTEVSLLHMA